MIALYAVLALADDASLRAPDPGVGTLVIGPTGMSATVWGPRVGLSTAIERDAAALYVGYRRAGSSATHVAFTFGAGLALPFHDPAPVLRLQPTLGIEHAGDVVAAVDLTSPLAVRVWPDPEVAVPVLLEGWLGGRIDAFTLGGSAGLGPVWTNRSGVAIDARAGIWLGLH